MRDVNRIPQILSAIEYVLKQKPEMTIGKLLVLLGGDPAVYYVEDYAFVKKVCELLDINLSPALTLDNENLRKLGEIWQGIPDLRLGQLVCNIIRDNTVLDEVSDEDLVDVLNQCYGG